MLVIDDNPADVCLLKMAVYSVGVPNLKVITDNGSTALELCSSAGSHPNNAVPDVVFLDLNLGQLSGFDVLECIRQNPHLDSTAVVIVSGSEHPKDIALSYQLNANAYMLKADNIEHWFQHIHAALKFWLLVRPNGINGG